MEIWRELIWQFGEILFGKMAQIDSIIWTEISAITLPLPHKFNINVKMDGQYYNLWSTDNDKTDANDDVVIKSVYDPSPVGYSLPASNAFTGFTTTGQQVGNEPNPLTPEQLAQLNVKGYLDKGWYFYCKPNKQGETVFFPTCGYLGDGAGSLLVVSTSGFYWVAGPYSTINGRYLHFSSGNVNPLDYYRRGCGFPVRSAEEVSALQLLQHTRRLTL